VVEDCNGSKCTYSCSNGGEPSATKLECASGKWSIDKTIKKKGITCSAGGDDGDTEGCGDFTRLEPGVLAQCSSKSCSFTCADESVKPSKDVVKCKCQKGKCNWDMSKKDADVSCGAEEKSAVAAESGKKSKKKKGGKSTTGKPSKGDKSTTSTGAPATEAVAEGEAPVVEEEAPAQRLFLEEPDTGCDIHQFGADVGFANCAGGKVRDFLIKQN
jgi:hypothetical protein